MGKQPALTELDPLTAEKHGLRFVLDAFGNHFQLQSLRHVNDVRRNAAAGRIMAERVDEGLVDLQAIHWQRLQVGEAAITGTEVIDQHLMAYIAQGLQVLPRHHHVDQSALGDFKGYLSRGDPVQRQQPGHDLADARHHHVAGGEVDRNVQLRIGAQHRSQLFQQPLQDKVCHLPDLPVFSANGMNRSGLVSVPSGRRQRSRASAPTQLRLSRSKIG